MLTITTDENTKNHNQVRNLEILNLIGVRTSRNFVSRIGDRKAFGDFRKGCLSAVKIFVLKHILNNMY